MSWKGSVQLYLFTKIEHMQYGCSVGHCHNESVAISNGGKYKQFKKPQILRPQAKIMYKQWNQFDYAPSIHYYFQYSKLQPSWLISYSVVVVKLGSRLYQGVQVFINWSCESSFDNYFDSRSFLKGKFAKAMQYYSMMIIYKEDINAKLVIYHYW